MPRRLPRANKCHHPGSPTCYVNPYVPKGASIPPQKFILNGSMKDVNPWTIDGLSVASTACPIISPWM